MKWKANARRRPKSNIRKTMDKASTALVRKPFCMSNGKPMVLWTHTVDAVEEDETGTKTITSTTFRQGEYIFPLAYLHPTKGIVGETKDARLTPRGWVIYLDAVLRDNSGKPVIVEGCEVDMSGWYLESMLQDANLGMELIRLGTMSQSVAEIEADRTTRIRRHMALMNRA